MDDKQHFYITTTLPYVNGRLHIGFALEIIQADVLARYHRLAGKKVFFLTGSDEHGSKIAKTAEQAGLTPKQLADTNSKAAKELKTVLNLSWDYFIRTTDKKNHWPGAEKVWKGLVASGDLYKKTYQGLYCTGCEAFLGDRDLEDGLCAIHNKEPELVEEENYFFRLSAYSKQLKNKIESGQMVIHPQWRQNEVLALIEKGLEDVSFSRSADNLTWGIPVPDDSTQTMYVWADALTNYISAIGYGRDQEEFSAWWPADIQVLGKDVLRFHAAIWPAMLLALGLEVPRVLFAHGFVTVEGHKMSKSLGNVVYPEDLVQQYGVDPVRYYFLREVSPFDDGDFSHARFVERYNGDLANGLGNFVARVVGMATKFGGIKNDFSMMELSVENRIKNTKEAVDEALREFRFNDAMAAIWELIAFGDGYVNQTKPWEKDKTSAQKEKALFNLLVIVNALSVFLSSFLPDTAKTIGDVVDFEGKELEIGSAPNLFPRLGE